MPGFRTPTPLTDTMELSIHNLDRQGCIAHIPEDVSNDHCWVVDNSRMEASPFSGPVSVYVGTMIECQAFMADER